MAVFAGRQFEKQAVAAQIPTQSHVAESAAIEQSSALSYQRLAAADILRLPFANFYEALRSAPGEARKQWANELMTMPEGPRRTAAVSGFYKLLVQFDPDAAIEAIREIEDVRLQSIALGAAVNGAPGFAMPQIAELSLSLQDRTSTRSNRDYVSDILGEWMLIDVSAVAKFIEEHPNTDSLESYDTFGIRQILHYRLAYVWAELDPKAARQWIEKNGDWDSSVRESFVEGWFENDPKAAVSYVLANVDDPGMLGEIGAVVRGLYYDSREQAAKFIESLPENKRRDALSEAFRRLSLGGDGEETGDVLTQRAVADWMIAFPPAYWKGTIGGLFGATRPGLDDMLSWIQQLPPDRRETVAAEYTPPFWKSTSEAIIGVLQMPDPVLRDQLFRATLQNQDRALVDARDAIASAPISSEQKNHLFQMVAAAEAEKAQDQKSGK